MLGKYKPQITFVHLKIPLPSRTLAVSSFQSSGACSQAMPSQHDSSHVDSSHKELAFLLLSSAEVSHNLHKVPPSKHLRCFESMQAWSVLVGRTTLSCATESTVEGHCSHCSAHVLESFLRIQAGSLSSCLKEYQISSARPP